MKTESKENLLLRGLADNDKKAIETIYKENYNVVQAFIVSNNGSSDDAKDIFQEAIIVLYEKVKTGSFTLNCQIRTYIYSVSKRLWLKRLMQQNRFSLTAEGHEDTVQVEDDLEEYERKEIEFRMMEKAVSGLGEPCKSLIEAFYVQKRNMQEIANSFGYTNADNAKNQKYKCLMRLKKLFFTQYKT